MSDPREMQRSLTPGVVAHGANSWESQEQYAADAHDESAGHDSVGAWAGDDDGSEGMRTSAELEDLGQQDEFMDVTEAAHAMEDSLEHPLR